MDFAATVVIQVLYATASLALISIGLAVIFGMMRVINFAHGEFLMLGGYAAVLPTHVGINLWVSMLVIAPITVGAFGVVIERLIIRPLYGRIVETVLATWGLSLLLIGIVSTVIGFYQEGAAPPFGSVLIGAYRVSIYTFFVIGITMAILAGVYLFLKFTHLGLIAQGTMQNAGMAAALGVNVDRVYAVTFGLGAALSGLAGAIFSSYLGRHAYHRHHIYCQGLHRGGRRRCHRARRNRGGVGTFRHHQSTCDVRDHSDHRRGGIVGGCDCAPASAAARNYRPLL